MSSIVFTYRIMLRWKLFFCFCLFCSFSLSATADLKDRYNEQSPLIIAGDWEFPPYEFCDSYGEPTGFYVDVLQTILDQLDIPHKFVLKEHLQATWMFDQHEAHLIVDPLPQGHAAPYYFSRSILHDYKMQVAYKKGDNPLPSLDQLPDNSILVIRPNDQTALNTLRRMAPQVRPEKHSPKNALGGLITSTYQYFLWGEESLKWKIKELSIQDRIELDTMSLPTYEVHFASYDQELVERLDDQYARIEQSGELDKLRDKWFYPEREHNDTSPMAIIITVLIFLVSVALWLLNRMVKQRVRVVQGKSNDLENMMRQALSLGNFIVMEYDVMHDRYTNRHGSMLPQGGLTLQQFISHIHPDERETATSRLKDLIEGRSGKWESDLCWNIETDEHPHWRWLHAHSFAETDEKGKTHYVLSTVKDVTSDIEQERRDSELASKYLKLFDSTQIAMSFYDRNGMLIELNENMRQLCEFDENGEAFFRKTCMFDIPLMRDDFDPHSHQQFYVCQRMNYGEAGVDKYIEIRVSPVYNDDELQYYIVTARDITTERQMYMELYQHDRELHKTSTTINQYERELNYLLENSQMWVWKSSLKTQSVSFSRSLRKSDYTQTFKDYMEGLYDDAERQKALQAFNYMRGTDANFNFTLHFRQSLANKGEQWMAISGIPLYDKSGQLTGHIGVVRDVSALIFAQERLKQETIRAEDSGKLKSVFLANMTHEIRTPLNAIVGFSDLLQVIDTPNERQEFIRIIRNNCDMLIRLINDIIEASSMNQGPLAIEAEDVDFAVAFNDICQTLSQRVQEPGVEFLIDNPYQTLPTHLDKGRLQQVITNFTTNAVKYTKQGHIKVGYRIEQNKRSDNGQQDFGIYMYCEDTGTGIPKEKQASVFERFVKLNDFVQGTGLGLSICKNIAERCNGRIGVESEGEGCGSTFWIWIPCELKSSQATIDTNN